MPTPGQYEALQQFLTWLQVNEFKVDAISVGSVKIDFNHRPEWKTSSNGTAQDPDVEPPAGLSPVQKRLFKQMNG